MDKAKLSDRIKYITIFWGITAIAGLYFFPAILLAYLNPFWFREDVMDSLQTQIHVMAKWRDLQVKPIVDKYKTFEILKGC